ncbi:MAG: hypothetical protein QNL88_07175 [Acidobacteriota bacterium]|nr:hypothetical protein [Acidobacteriota bacterium]
MKPVFRISMIVIALALAPLAVAADLEPDTDGPWINVDVYDLADYGDATFLEYLGKGYVAMLDALKTEGLILDYGVMMKTTGNAGDGDVVVWWSVQSLGDYETAGARMEAMAAEMHSGEEWGEIWSQLQKVRSNRSSNFYRAVLWNKAE